MVVELAFIDTDQNNFVLLLHSLTKNMPPKQPANLSPAVSPTPSMVSKGQSSNPESPVQSKIDITSTTEKQKKLPWAQRKQVHDL